MCHDLRRSPQHPAAFTLVEVTLVLGILIVIGAIVAPAASALINRQRLSHGADQVRSELIQARLEAMRSGRPQVLQFGIGSGTLNLQPWVDPADATEAADMAGTVMPGAMTAATPMTNPTGKSVELVEGIICEQVEVVSDTRASSIMNAVATNPTGVTATDGTVAAAALPIVFYPDGTSSDAMITVSGPSGKVRLLLRGLTGDVSRLEAGT